MLLSKITFNYISTSVNKYIICKTFACNITEKKNIIKESKECRIAVITAAHRFGNQKVEIRNSAPTRNASAEI